MPYISDIITDPAQMAKPFFRVEFPPELVAKADRVEVESSSFGDPGPDWNRYKLMAGEQCLATTRVVGY